MFFLILIVLCVTSLLIIANGRRRRPKNFPPGPLSLPIIGGLYKLGKDPFIGSVKLWKEYGPIVGIDFASYRSILINDHKLLKAAFSNPSLQGRPDIPLFRTKFRVKDGMLAGIMSSEGLKFQENHRFTLKTLREFGFGTKEMENAIINEIDKISTHFHLNGENGIESESLFNPYTANIIWSLLSARLIPSESERGEAVKLFEQIKQEAGVSAVSMLLPVLIKLIPGPIRWNHFLNLSETFMNIFHNCIKNHKEQKCRAENDKDFIDLWLDEIQNETQNPSSIFYGEFGDFNLAAVLADMIAGGVDTTAETMAWALAIVTAYPDIQEKLHYEIDRVVGHNEKVALAHRKKLVYVEAFIKEILRFKPVAPWGLPHKATEDCQISNYHVPKGATIYGNFFAIGQDPLLWNDPEIFRPTRFIASNGELLSIEGFTPFSSGRRICPGRSLGMEEMFLILSNIFREFHITAKGDDPISLKHSPFFVLTPKPFQFIATRRHKKTHKS